MKIKPVITGTTGMVGKGVLLECLDSPDVESVLVINRKPLGIKHPKLKEILHKDFFDLSAIESEMKGYDACFFCLGVSSAGMKEPEYTDLTYNLTLAFAKVFIAQNPGSVFCYVSGAGTDSSEKGRIMWARVKGRIENALLDLPFKAAYMFRPGFIEPLKGIKSSTRLYNTLYVVLRPLFPVFRAMPKFATDTARVGKAMINIAIKGYGKKHLECIDINEISKQSL
ncbi:MAG: epimerase [Bacteroidetes bacterium]|nr:epimerase [Bacteroidota bacterium]